MNDSIILLIKLALMFILLLDVIILVFIVAGIFGSAIYSFITFIWKWLDHHKWF